MTNRAELELWGGIECTVNRLHDRYFDQVVRTGHHDRDADLELFASLGIRALRYPVLWERTAPQGYERQRGVADWTWPDARLARLRELGIKPIVTLVHHGSSPLSGGLLDPHLPEALADYALQAARRYPWVEYWTPINEPLTTARFSALYGHWYPHAHDASLFARAMVNECQAIARTMRAIRSVNPDAKLLQTEDLGKTHSTPLLAYQAEFENERRWLTFDLLYGRVDRDHPLWGYLTWLGIEEGDLTAFLEEPCAPDLLGLNYYPTSERYLDEDLGRFPEGDWGGNGQHAYVDVDAVRALAQGMDGPLALLREAWERFEIPVAVTEVQLDCTPEEQVRWFHDVWRAACALRDEGADVRAVTAWALLGSYDWDSLVTRIEEHYEAGAFDIRAPAPRPTALAHMLTEISSGRSPSHPALASPGWWQRPQRLLYSCGATTDGPPTASRQSAIARPILITGVMGTLGSAFVRICEHRGLAYKALTRDEMDVADIYSVQTAIEEYEPWAVVNAAGYVRVDDAECDVALCFRENTIGPATLAAVCAEVGVRLLTFSSDLVFDGAKGSPYMESDPVCPLNVYGQTKSRAECGVLATWPKALVVRTSAFFGPWDRYNFVTLALRSLRHDEPFVAADDAVVSPTYVPDLANAALDLLVDGAEGIWHLANKGEITWHSLACCAADLAGLDQTPVQAAHTSNMGLRAARPLYSALSSERAWIMPPLEDALERYIREYGADGGR